MDTHQDEHICILLNNAIYRTEKDDISICLHLRCSLIEAMA